MCACQFFESLDVFRTSHFRLNQKTPKIEVKICSLKPPVCVLVIVLNPQV